MVSQISWEKVKRLDHALTLNDRLLLQISTDAPVSNDSCEKHRIVYVSEKVRKQQGFRPCLKEMMVQTIMLTNTCPKHLTVPIYSGILRRGSFFMRTVANQSI